MRDFKRGIVYLFAWFAPLVTSNAFAATITVTNTNDSGSGSLRDAIANAAPGDTINFSLTYPATITLASTLTIGKNLTIGGPGASSLAISGGGTVRVFSIGACNIISSPPCSGVTASISGVTIENGSGYYGGGGVYNTGTLIISNSALTGNSSNTANGGGAIYNYLGILTVTDSTLSGNSANSVAFGQAADGGGIFNYFGTVSVSNSTLSGNSASSYCSDGTPCSFGGGIANVSGTLSLVNSTLYANSAIYGGGVYNSGGQETVINSTLSGNSATYGGGFSNYGGLALRNTIVAGSTSGGNCSGGNPTSFGHNLSDDATCALSSLGDMNSLPAALDPSGLQNNGGPTQTIALLAFSPAINAGDDAVCAAAPINNLDQRGFVRPARAHCDIGAYEFPPSPDTLGPVTSNLFVTPNPLAINTSAAISAIVSDVTTGGSNVAAAFYTVNGGSASQMSLTPSAVVTAQASASLASFSLSNVYNVCVHGTDMAGNTGADTCIPIPVYDPNGSFVTGGGQVASPQGADLLNTTAAGQATFGFVSKYLPGRNTPTGNLEFQFKEGNLNFTSTSMDWLVVTGEPRAKFHGTGTVNGTSVCDFEVDAWAGSFAGNTDAFGLKISSCSNGGDRYNLPATQLTQGSIIIHK